MGLIIRPFPCGRNPLAGGNHGGVANDGDKIAVAACLDPNDAKSVVGILAGDALNQPGEHLPIRWLRLRVHDVHGSGLVANTLAPAPSSGAIWRPRPWDARDVAISAIRPDHRRWSVYVPGFRPHQKGDLGLPVGATRFRLRHNGTTGDHGKAPSVGAAVNEVLAESQFARGARITTSHQPTIPLLIGCLPRSAARLDAKASMSEF
jgi:hypothetical protein